MITVYEVSELNDDQTLNIYEHTTNGYFGLKRVIEYSCDDEKLAINIANRLSENCSRIIPGQINEKIILVY